ncbi:receptor-like serine/threonine-protein kinase SD1-8 isoform X3 [Canna indica]|uniref:Receptor-like serine/threonine-protein kinase SD1-8 isoform X3 n=1 Tax=Canna indica TaxID=4628 RepID=A0AAQ3KHN2_9LILI|nr:receptor-like serine/threonine-protein kinase SD1-8 isoform X3 [Canna indica]
MKLPDTSRSMVDWRMSLEECRATCSKNCSCTAYASANVSGSASGCIMWTTDLTDIRWYEGDIGQDIYVRLAAADIESQSNSHHTHLAAIILVPTLTIFLAVCGACYVWRRKKREHYINVDEEKQVKDMDLPLYDLDTIREATKDFSIDNKLGQGGFGPVYKGKMIEEKEIAVKRLSKTSVQGVDEFMNEVMLIAKLQHRNLVQLLGCCIQGGERILIYEYMPNGSLDAFLFDETKSMLLDWPTRYNITVGIARALIYLHQDSRLTIIHRDLKAGNVLLDEDMNPKISDFGMARIFGGEDSEANTRRVVGTYGYMSPEYAMDGNFSVKSDVFSFGVLLLEIITSRKNRGVYNSAHHLNLLGHVWSLWNEDKAMEIIDKSIEHTYLVSEVLTCIKIGLLCVQEQPRDRPTMTMVLKMLDSNYNALPEPRQPGFVASRGSSTITQLSSTNSLSMTILEGR